jgi:hypothetical protein
MMEADEFSTIVSLENYQPDVTYTEALKLCEELGLLETVMHGEHEYGRLTQRGINVATCLMKFLTHTADPNNILKKA